MSATAGMSKEMLAMQLSLGTYTRLMLMNLMFEYTLIDGPFDDIVCYIMPLYT